MSMTVAIVSYNTREHLRACLESVVAERPPQVVVVDNASTDGSPEMVRAYFPEVELVAAPNEGFGAGANLAIEQARLPFVLLLNSDTRLHPGCLTELTAYLQTHPEAGMVGPRLVNPDGTLQPSIYPLPSPTAELVRWTSVRPIAGRVPRLRQKYLIDCPHDRALRVGWVAGAALAIRKSAFEAVGGFDTSFFMYSEEVDLAYSMEEAGWQVHFAPVTTVTHFGGASTEAHRSDMMTRLFDSMVLLYRKHFSRDWQRKLKVIITYVMLRNLLRDRWRLLRTRGPKQYEQLAQDLAAWRRVLRTIWSG